MARKLKKTAANTKGTKAGTAVTVTAVMGASADLPFYYVNHIEISHSHYEFALTAGRAPAKLTEHNLREINEFHRLTIEPVIQLLIPPTVIPALIRALTIQQESYETTHGKLDKRDA